MLHENGYITQLAGDQHASGGPCCRCRRGLAGDLLATWALLRIRRMHNSRSEPHLTRLKHVSSAAVVRNQNEQGHVHVPEAQASSRQVCFLHMFRDWAYTSQAACRRHAAPPQLPWLQPCVWLCARLCCSIALVCPSPPCASYVNAKMQKWMARVGCPCLRSSSTCDSLQQRKPSSDVLSQQTPRCTPCYLCPSPTGRMAFVRPRSLLGCMPALATALFQGSILLRSLSPLKRACPWPPYLRPHFASPSLAQLTSI